MDYSANDTLGLQVRVERVRLRLKQSELAAIAGVSQADVSQLERDKKLGPARRKPILGALGIIDGSDVPKPHKASELSKSQRKRSESSHRRDKITPRQVIVRKVCSEADNAERVTRLAAILSNALSRKLAQPCPAGSDANEPVGRLRLTG